MTNKPLFKRQGIVRQKSGYPTIQKRSAFLGRKIRSSNYRQIQQEFFDYFINVEAKREEYGTWTAAQTLKGAKMYSKFMIGMNKEMEKAHSKGKTHFKYKGKVHAVLVDNDPDNIILASEMGHLQEVSQEEE